MVGDGVGDGDVDGDHETLAELLIDGTLVLDTDAKLERDARKDEVMDTEAVGDARADCVRELVVVPD